MSNDDTLRAKYNIPSLPDEPPRGFDMSSHQANVSNMTAEQRLAFANKQMFQIEREKASQVAEAPLTDAEIAPYSRPDFEKLRPELRMDIYNRAIAARRAKQ